MITRPSSVRALPVAPRSIGAYSLSNAPAIQARLRAEGLFSAPVIGENGLVVNVGFGDGSSETARGAGKVILDGERALSKYLSIPERMMHHKHSISEHRTGGFSAALRRSLCRNPLSLITRDADRQVRSVVEIVTLPVTDAAQLPCSAAEMARADLKSGDALRTALACIWVTGGGDGKLAHAMVDGAIEMGRHLDYPDLGIQISHLYAYSTPRSYHLVAHEMSVHDYVELVRQGKRHDGALTFHFKRGAKVARIIEGGYKPIDLVLAPWAPVPAGAIGHGYVVVMEYPPDLPHPLPASR